MNKKISIVSLGLILALSDICVVNAAPHRSKNMRRQASVSNISSTVQNISNISTITNPIVSNVDNSVPLKIEIQKNTLNTTQALNDLVVKTQAVQNACSGIKSSLDTIFGLSVATTVSSGLGTVAAGGALAVGITKAVKDKKIEEKEVELNTLESRTQNLSDDPEELKKQLAKIMPKLEEDYAKLKKEIDTDTKKSKILGNVRTGLMAGATATSAVSTGTSIGATLTATKLAEKMAECNNALKDLKMAKSTAEAEEVEPTDTSVIKAGEILAVCTGYDESNIKSLKTLATANTIVSGIGTATAGAGTITSAMANSKKVRAGDKKKEKNLNLASNILAGVTMGTSGTSTALSAVQINKAKKDSEMAEKCEAVLQ